MATYQYSFEVVPRTILDRKKITVPSFVSQCEYEVTNWWEGVALPSTTIDEIARKLNRENSWSNEIVQFGNLESTNIQLVYELGKIIEFLVRIDLRSITREMLDSILTIIFKCEGVILSEANNLYSPSDIKFIKEIKQSPSYMFANNFKEWTKNLRE